MEKETVLDKLNELDASSVTPQVFEEVWGISKEEHLKRMMDYIHKRKAEAAAKEKKKHCKREDVEDWIGWMMFQTDCERRSCQAAFYWGYKHAVEELERLKRFHDDVEALFGDTVDSIDVETLAGLLKKHDLVEHPMNLDNLATEIRQVAEQERQRKKNWPKA